MHVYVTNNASRTPHELVADLAAMGVMTDETHVFTSAQAAARLAVAQVGVGAEVLVVGGSGVREAVASVGLRPVDGRWPAGRGRPGLVPRAGLAPPRGGRVRLAAGGVLGRDQPRPDAADEPRRRTGQRLFRARPVAGVGTQARPRGRQAGAGDPHRGGRRRRPQPSAGRRRPAGHRHRRRQRGRPRQPAGALRGDGRPRAARCGRRAAADVRLRRAGRPPRPDASDPPRRRRHRLLRQRPGRPGCQRPARPPGGWGPDRRCCVAQRTTYVYNLLRLHPMPGRPRRGTPPAGAPRGRDQRPARPPGRRGPDRRAARGLWRPGRPRDRWLTGRLAASIAVFERR